jgi:phage-related tail protein
MLSDERIRQIAIDNWKGIHATLPEDILNAIRAALAEAAQVTVMRDAEFDSDLFERAYAKGYRAALGAAAAECRKLATALDNGGNEYTRYPDYIKIAEMILTLRVPGAYGSDSADVPITQTELDAKDARISMQHRQLIEEMARTEAVKQELEAKDARIKELEESASDMLRELRFVECVYRKNFVAEGEPSSVLYGLQETIKRAAIAKERQS